MLALFSEYLLAECWFGPVVAALQSSLPPDTRALAIACFGLIATFFGSLAAFAIGLVYDALLRAGHAPTVIRWLVLASVSISYSTAGSLFLYGSTLDDEANRRPRRLEANPLLTPAVTGSGSGRPESPDSPDARREYSI